MTEADETVVLDNPAARLQFWLRRAKKLAEVATLDARNHPHSNVRTEPHLVRECWSAIWGLPSAGFRWEHLEFYKRGLAMIDQGVEVRIRVEASTNFMAPDALRYFGEVENALNYFAKAPDGSIVAMMDCIGTTGWHSLEMLSTLLRNEAPNPEVSGSSIDDLVKQVRELVDGILASSELSAEQKQVLTEKLSEVESALRRASIAGTDEVVRAIDGLMGGILRLNLRGLDVRGHPAMKAVWAFIGLVLGVVSFGGDVSSIVGGPFADLLGLPSPGGG